MENNQQDNSGGGMPPNDGQNMPNGNGMDMGNGQQNNAPMNNNNQWNGGQPNNMNNMPPQQGYGPQGGYGPQQPYPPQGYPQPAQQKPPKEPMDPKKKKMIILLCSIGGGLLVLGILAAIILPIILKIDYEETYTKAKDLDSAIVDMESYSSCWGVIDYAGSTYTTTEKYNEYLTTCTDAIANVKTQTDAVSATSGLRDSELKPLWETYKTNHDRLVPAYEKAAKVYPGWHEFRISQYNLEKASNWYETVTEDKLKAVIKPIEESEIESFSKYAEGYKTKYIPYVMAYKKQALAREAWNNTSYSSSNYATVRDAYYAAREATEAALNTWNEWKSNNSVDLATSEVLGVDLDKSENDLGDYFYEFNSELYSKYLDEAVEKTFGI